MLHTCHAAEKMMSVSTFDLVCKSNFSVCSLVLSENAVTSCK